MTTLGLGLSAVSITVIEYTDWTHLIYVPTPGSWEPEGRMGKKALLGNRIEKTGVIQVEVFGGEKKKHTHTQHNNI